MVGCADTIQRENGDRPPYVVRLHDTLYSIAWRYHLDYQDLAKWNNIGAGYRITVGQSLRLVPPHNALSTAGPARSPPSTAPATGASVTARGAAANSAANGGSGPAGRGPTAPPSALKWIWPTERLAALRPVPGGGILLPGRIGQDIRAACAGRVVYAGNGLRGYGNLIIIKHAENLLSAYAHNRELLVHDGDDVTLGQVIGHMGEGAPQTPVLYFEIRRNGKPVDPVPFLPISK